MSKQARDYRIYLSTTDAVDGSRVELECSGDFNIDFGITLQQQQFKDCTESYVERTGMKVDGSYAFNPLGVAAQDIMSAASEAGTTVYAWIEHKTEGAKRWHGNWHVALSALPLPVNGLTIMSFQMNISGTEVVDVTPSAQAGA
ncbi:MAG: hypothetical protein MRY63_06390 [Neomegalonema sp.]|nr:hypothetical protein [Neomegalonema sp.]